VAEALLNEQLSPTRRELKELEDEQFRLLDEFQEREQETSTRWDRRISAAKGKDEKALADYQIQTRSLMEEAVARLMPNASSTEALGGYSSKLLEIVPVRAELARTPRVLALEKAASDETLVKLLVEGGDADRFDSTLISQEKNSLYDQLLVSVLELESELKRAAGARLAELSTVLTELEKIQLERAAGLAALLQEHGLELRILRRGRSFALRDIGRKRAAVISEYQRKLEQLRGLEARLSTELNTTSISGLLDQVNVVNLASPAARPQKPESQKVPLKVALATILGGMLGLMIALFRRGLGYGVLAAPEEMPPKKEQKGIGGEIPPEAMWNT